MTETWLSPEEVGELTARSRWTALVVALVLPACAVTNDQIEAAQRFCEPHGGLLYIPGRLQRGYETIPVECADGSWAHVKVRRPMRGAE